MIFYLRRSEVPSAREIPEVDDSPEPNLGWVWWVAEYADVDVTDKAGDHAFHLVSNP